MYGKEYLFKGTIKQFVAVMTTYSELLTYRGTPGPHGPFDMLTRLEPGYAQPDDELVYAKYKLMTRFVLNPCLIRANSLPSNETLIVVDLDTRLHYEDQSARDKLEQAWEQLHTYLARHGWCDPTVENVDVIRRQYHDLSDIKDPRHRLVIEHSKRGRTVPEIAEIVGYSEAHTKRIRAKYRM